MKTLPIAACWTLLLAPLWASSAESEETAIKPLLADVSETEGSTATVPEPSTLVVAGIGSLAILLFAKRRK